MGGGGGLGSTPSSMRRIRLLPLSHTYSSEEGRIGQMSLRLSFVEQRRFVPLPAAVTTMPRGALNRATSAGPSLCPARNRTPATVITSKVSPSMRRMVSLLVSAT